MMCQCSFNISPISAASKVMKGNMSQRSENEVVKFIVVVVVVNEIHIVIVVIIITCKIF